jgi:hypothetical protein
VCVGFILGGPSHMHYIVSRACKLLALFVLASPLREQGPSTVRYEYVERCRYFIGYGTVSLSLLLLV